MNQLPRPTATDENSDDRSVASVLPSPRTSARRSQSGKALPWIIAGLLAAAAAGGWWWWSSSTSTAASATGSPAANAGAGAAKGGPAGAPGQGNSRFGGPNRVQPVSVATARKQDIRVTVSAIGTIAAANTAVVRTKVDGELKALHFKEGQIVKAGALLAEIDRRPFEIALAQAQGTLARDTAQLQNAKLDLERFRDLVAKDAAPKQQLDTQDALVRQLQGTVLSDQAQVDNAKLQLSYTRVIAPISGLVGLKQADLGNVVRASDTNGLLSIAQTQPVNVVFAVPDVYLPKISKQLKAGETLRVEAWDRDQKSKLADGKVASTDNAIDATTGTIKLKALFANVDNGLFPNQFVNVRLQMDTLADAVAVPSAAVLRGTQGNYVYAVNEDKTVSVKRVRPGASDGDWMSVQGEVKVGDVVVTDGTDRLREGAQVEVVVPAAPGAGGNRGGPGGRNRAAGEAATPAAGSPPTGQSVTTPSGTSPAPAVPSKSGAVGGSPAGASPAATPASAATAPAPASPPAAGAAAAGDRPAWMDRLPPDVQEKLRAMTPDERAAWIQKRREERAKRQAEGGGPPN